MRPPETPAGPLTRSHAEPPANPAATLSGPPNGPSSDEAAPTEDRWATLTAWIARHAHRTAFDDPATAGAEWARTDQPRWHHHATAVIRHVLTAAADAYEQDVRATRHLHPRQNLTWPHTDFRDWLLTEAGRADVRPAQTEPGS